MFAFWYRWGASPSSSPGKYCKIWSFAESFIIASLLRRTRVQNHIRQHWVIYGQWLCVAGLRTVECRYNAVQYSEILHTLLQSFMQLKITVWTHKIHPIPRPNGPAIGCILWGFGKNDRVITAPHYIRHYWHQTCRALDLCWQLEGRSQTIGTSIYICWWGRRD